MKTELKAKFIQHLAAKKGDKGFTLIELLVVIIIIGILSAIALPSFLNQANKARQSEAATYVGSINRAQQAYFLEKNEFGALTDIEVGISATDNYTYTTTPSGAGTSAVAATTASPAGVLKGYGGKVWISTSGSSATTEALLCEGTAGGLPTIGTTCP